jgi:hypothetical protein
LGLDYGFHNYKKSDFIYLYKKLNIGYENYGCYNVSGAHPRTGSVGREPSLIGTVFLEIGKQVVIGLIVFAVQDFVLNKRRSKKMNNTKKKRTNNKKKHKR